MSDSYKIYASKEYVDSKILESIPEISWDNLSDKPFGDILVQGIKTLYFLKKTVSSATEIIEGTYYYKNLATVDFSTFPEDSAFTLVFNNFNGGESAINAQETNGTNTINFKFDGYEKVDMTIEEDKSLTLIIKPKAETNHVESIQIDFADLLITFTTLETKYLPTTVPVIQSASAGQTIVVKSVDENNKPTEWEAVDITTQSGVTEDRVNELIAEALANIPNAEEASF